MTPNEARDVITAYERSVQTLSALISLESLAFASRMLEIEKVLGVKLARPLTEVGLPSAISAYLAVLSNSVKGQGVAAGVEDEWPTELN